MILPVNLGKTTSISEAKFCPDQLLVYLKYKDKDAPSFFDIDKRLKIETKISQETGIHFFDLNYRVNAEKVLNLCQKKTNIVRF